jgi:hypothetical protein
VVPLTSLWLPILLSAVFVFLASFIIHMVLKYHRTDYSKFPAEDQVLEALRRLNIPPGDYFGPHGGGPEAMKDPAFIDKMKKGPIVIATFLPTGPPTMGAQLGQWFLYCVVVSLFAGYIASRALGPGAPYLDVSQFASTTAFCGYGLALWQNTIWYKRKWTTTMKSTIDSLIYGFLTGGVFGWLWPR